MAIKVSRIGASIDVGHVPQNSEAINDENVGLSSHFLSKVEVPSSSAEPLGLFSIAAKALCHPRCVELRPAGCLSNSHKRKVFRAPGASGKHCC